MTQQDQNRYIKAFALTATVILLAPEWLPHLAHAADTVVNATPTPSGVPVILASPTPVPVVNVAAGDISGVDFFTQIFNWLRQLGGLTFVAKMTGLVALIIASMKVSFARPLWDKFGYFKVLVTPILSLLIGVISLGAAGHVTLAALGAYLFSGGGAVILHEILDCLKAIPGLSPIYLNVIAFASKVLGGPVPMPADEKIPNGMGTQTNPSASVVTNSNTNV